MNKQLKFSKGVIHQRLKTFNDFYKSLITHHIFNANAKFKKVTFKSTLQTAFIKCIEFNYFISRLSSSDNSFFYLGSLRGICEDLIALSYLKTLPIKERNEFILYQIRLDTEKDIIVQHEFFSNENPAQIIMDPAKLISDSRKKYILNKPRRMNDARKQGYMVLPSVFEMAKITGYDKLYLYFYHATSNIVHFKPSVLAGLCWGNYNEKGKVDNYRISVNNYSLYYLDFNIIYGTYFFREFLSTFKELDIRSSVKKDLLVKINNILDRDWPELVTFEHMNLKPPSSIIRILHRANYNVLKQKK